MGEGSLMKGPFQSSPAFPDLENLFRQGLFPPHPLRGGHERAQLQKYTLHRVARRLRFSS